MVDLYAGYISRRDGQHRFLTGRPLSSGPFDVREISVVLDLVYLFIAAAFLGVCVLYTLACDRL
jgi:hypothetical protein